MERAAWLVKRTDSSVTAFSPSCTHLGCGCQWFPADRRFKCPCHGSVFDIAGKVLAGPAPRPLDGMPAKTEDGRLLVKFEVFQVGIARKVLARREAGGAVRT